MTIDFAILLTPAEARVLGSLLEKEATTPDYYPLSLNALVNACNQRSNREPVMDLDEEAVGIALHGLEDLRLAGRARRPKAASPSTSTGSARPINFSRAESALICVLLLRGPQTPGELRSRTERLHRFDEIADVLAGLQKLSERTPPLVAVLPRQPGTKESRYMHLLCGPVDSVAASAPSTAYPAPVSAHALARPPAAPDDPAPGDSAIAPRIARLEARVAELTQKLDTLNKKFDDLFGD